ncbi:MAG: molybdopterin synthase catalytic subunit [bacterium]
MELSICPDPAEFTADKLIKSTGNEKTGAKVTFRGTVRNKNRGKTVSHLVYECYPEMVRQKINDIFERARKKHSNREDFQAGVNLCLGKIPVGEISVVITVASVHREPAFSGCRYILEKLKKEVPIWKKEAYEDSEAWIQNREDYNES